MGDFLHFSWVLAHGFFRCPRFGNICPRKNYGAVRKDLVNDFGGPGEVRRASDGFKERRNRNWLFSLYSWVLAHGFFRCPGSEDICPRKNYMAVHKDPM